MNTDTALALPHYLNQFRIVLTRPSHPGNIGSAARAMKTMGITQLYLVSPQKGITDESRALSAGALDVLEHAIVTNSLAEALADVSFACGLTSRRRELTTPIQTPRAMMPELVHEAKAGAHIAFVFGNETSGLSADELSSCNRLMTIAGNPDYFSLNLAMAVQTICYELFTHTDVGIDHLKQSSVWATRAETEGFYGHLDETLDKIGYYEKRNGERLMRRLKTLFDRTGLQREEIDILRGFLKQVQRRSQAK